MPSGIQAISVNTGAIFVIQDFLNPMIRIAGLYFFHVHVRIKSSSQILENSHIVKGFVEKSTLKGFFFYIKVVLFIKLCGS